MQLTLETIQRREALNRDGFLVIPQVLGEAALHDLREYGREVIRDTSIKDYSTAGCLGRPDYRHPAMIGALTNPSTLAILGDLGYAQPKLHSAFFTAKYRSSAGLSWHSDIYYDFETTAPTELFLLQYLDDTTPENGCLRIVPGSHRRPRPDEQLRSKRLEDEVDLPMRAGDLLVGDRRLWHATHPNKSDTWRRGLTVAMAPSFATLPEEIQARIVAHQGFKGWWPKQAGTLDLRLEAILPTYAGNAEPIKLLWQK